MRTILEKVILASSGCFSMWNLCIHTNNKTNIIFYCFPSIIEGAAQETTHHYEVGNKLDYEQERFKDLLYQEVNHVEYHDDNTTTDSSSYFEGDRKGN